MTEKTLDSADIDRFAELVTEIEVNLKLVEASRSALNVAVATPTANKSALRRTYSPLWTLSGTTVDSAQRGLNFAVTPTSGSYSLELDRTPGLTAVTPLPEQGFWYLNKLAENGWSEDKVAEPGLLGLPVGPQSSKIALQQPQSACKTSARSVDAPASTIRRSIKRQHSAHIEHKENRSFSRGGTVESHAALAKLQAVHRKPGTASLLKVGNGFPDTGSDKRPVLAEWRQELLQLGTDASEAKCALETTFLSAERDLQVLYDQLSAKADTSIVRIPERRLGESRLNQAKEHSRAISDRSSPVQQPAPQLHAKVQAENHTLSEARHETSVALADCMRRIAELEEENNRLKSAALGKPCLPYLAQNSREAQRQADEEEGSEHCAEEASGSKNAATSQALEPLACLAIRPSSSPEVILAESSLPSRLASEDSDLANDKDANRAAENSDAREGSSPSDIQDANGTAGDENASEGSSSADGQDAKRTAEEKDAREGSSPVGIQDANKTAEDDDASEGSTSAKEQDAKRAAENSDARECSNPSDIQDASRATEGKDTRECSSSADGQDVNSAAKDEVAREGGTSEKEQDAKTAAEHQRAVEMPAGSGQRVMPRLSSGAARSSWDSPFPVLSSEKATSALNGTLFAIRQQDSLGLVGQQKTPPSRRHSPLEALVHYLCQEELTP